MIEKWEKLSTVLEKGKPVDKYSEVKKKDATHLHKCRHDEDPPKACERIKL